MKTNETYYSDKLKAIINETFNYGYNFKDTWVVEKDKALSIAKQHLSFTNDIEKHIYNTIKAILNDPRYMTISFENKASYIQFVDNICYSFINATMKKYKQANYMYHHFPVKLNFILKLEQVSVMNKSHLEKAYEYADIFFIKNITLTLDNDYLNLHKNIYKKALTSSFENGIRPKDFWIKLRFNIFKTYEIELLSRD